MTSDDRSFAGGIGSPAGSGELVFTYDGLSRVTNTTLAGSAQASYTYDRSSNRTSKTENGSTFLFTFDATDVLATQKKDTGAVEAFIYDKAGNLTKELTAGATYRTNTWDAANRLTAIAPAAGSAAVLTYDPLGRIATRKVGTDPTTTYGYAGTSDVVVRQAASSTTTYLATPAGARMGTSTVGTAQWLLYDLLGSVVASEPAGSGTTAIGDALRYDAYGQTLGLAPAGGSTLGLRFRGLIDLAPTADPDVAGAGSDPLYQMGARAYAPHLGTFTALDTYAGRAQDPISLNRYLYAHANPTSLIDPSGHGACKAGKKCAQGSDRVSVVDRDDNTTVYSGGQQVGSSSGGGGGSGTSSTGNTNSGGAVPPPTAPTTVFIGHIMVDPFGIPFDDGDAFALYDICLQGVDAATEAACASYQAWLQVAHLERLDLHMALDAMGFFPVAGALTDLTSGLLYLLEGDHLQAAASLVAALPLGGDIVGGGRYVAKYGDDVVAGVTRSGDDVAGAANGVGKACHSFSADTVVHRADGGTVPIAHVRIGDTVEAMDPATGRTSSYTVSATFVHHDPTTGTVEIDGEPIATTPGHQFLTVARGWVDAEDLQAGERIASVTGAPGIVGDVRWDRGPAMMYDLAVEQVHTFAVGDGGWVVHNLDCDKFADAFIAKNGGQRVELKPSGTKQVIPDGSYELRPGWMDHHTIAILDGRVYDEFTGAGGMAIEQWKLLWDPDILDLLDFPY